MRLAFITSLVPARQAITGFEIANAAILAALRADGHEVKVFGFQRPDDPVPEDADTTVIDRFDIENAAVGKLTQLRWIADALRWNLPVASAKLRRVDRGRWAAAIRAAHAQAPFDGVILNAAIAPGACPDLMTIAPCLLVEHNVEHRSAAQNAAHARSPVLRWLYAREARLLERIELQTCAAARFVWCLAKEDQAALGLDPARSATLPLITVQDAQPTPAGVGVTHDVGLIGTWTWEPNRIGLAWFLQQVVPLLPAHVSVAVAGRVPEATAAQAPAHVALLGRVPDAGAFLAGCRTIALTSRAGTGVQLKTVEAFQLGKPAVATGLSLRGFTEVPANVRRADEAPAFAAALTHLVRDVRAGQVGDADGAAFLAHQRQAMRLAIARGLATLRDG